MGWALLMGLGAWAAWLAADVLHARSCFAAGRAWDYGAHSCEPLEIRLGVMCVQDGEAQEDPPPELPPWL